jgi:hypothetical protein
MRAELTIGHKSGDVLPSLARIFGASDAAALTTSSLAAKSPGTAQSIGYAAYAPGLILLAWDTPDQVVLYVESAGGRLRDAASKVWTATHKGCRRHRLKLDSLVLLDEDKGDEIAKARVGLGANAQRAEFLTTATVGLATLAVLALALSGVIEGFTFTTDVAIGALPALIAAGAALLSLIRATASRRLVWK